VRLGKPDDQEADQYIKLEADGIDVYEYKNNEELEKSTVLEVDAEGDITKKLVIYGKKAETLGCR